MTVLNEGCVNYPPSANGLNDHTCSSNLPFACEFTNQSLVSCPGNLYLDSILGCGWFKLIILKKLNNFLFIIKYLVNKQTYNQPCSSNIPCKYYQSDFILN